MSWLQFNRGTNREGKRAGRWFAPRLEALEERVVLSAATALQGAQQALQLAQSQAPLQAQQLLGQVLGQATQAIAGLSQETTSQAQQDIQTLGQVFQTSLQALNTIQQQAPTQGAQALPFAITQEVLSFQLANTAEFLDLSQSSLPGQLQQSLLTGVQQVEQALILGQFSQIGQAEQVLGQALTSAVVGLETALGNVPQGTQPVLHRIISQVRDLTQDALITLVQQAPPQNPTASLPLQNLAFLAQDIDQLEDLAEQQVPADLAFATLGALEETQLSIIQSEFFQPKQGEQSSDQALRHALQFLQHIPKGAEPAVQNALNRISRLALVSLTIAEQQATPQAQAILNQAIMQLQGLPSQSPTQAQQTITNIISELQQLEQSE